MSPVDQYKKVERKIVNRFVDHLRNINREILNFFTRVIDYGRQRFTVMLIPHSEKKIFNFKLSLFSFVFIGFLFGCILIVFFLFATKLSGISQLLSDKSENLNKTEINLEMLLDEIAAVRKVSASFESTLNQTMGTLKLNKPNDITSSVTAGDLSSFFGIEEQEEGVMQELSELQSLAAYLEDSVDSLQKIKNLLAAQRDLLVEMPTLWPVEGGDGIITNYFGPEDHPFTHKWYLHKGIDIAYGFGKPVLAAANGKIIEKKFDNLGFGHYVLIRHKYGFQTKYAHLQQVYVNEGDNVTQGQKIGTMGSSGLSTGPHLHFEIRIGSQVVDPIRFLDIQNVLR